MSLESKKSFFTLESREESRFTEFKKKYRLYTRKNEFLPSARYIYDREDCPPTEGLSFVLKYSWTPTDEQKHVIDVIKLRKAEYKYGCWLIIMGTGKGKGHIAMQIANELQTTTLILCHNVKTLEEMVEKFKEFTNIIPWVYYGKKKAITQITITTHKSFMQDMLDEEESKLKDFDVIIYDECDYSLDRNMFQALAKSGAKYLYWMTGTPYKKELNTEDFEKVFGKRIVCLTVKKYNIVPYRIHVYRYKAEEPYIYENWAEQRAEMFNNKHRRKYQISVILKHYKTGNASLVLSERVEEVKMLFEALKEAWVHCAMITGETKTQDDNEVIDKLEKWEVSVIIATTGKVARWVDIPIIDTIFMYAWVQFEWTIVQAVWRALRKHPKKERVEIIDFSDDECRNQRYQRVKAYQAEYWLNPAAITIYKPPKHDSRNWLFLN